MGWGFWGFGLGFWGLVALLRVCAPFFCVPFLFFMRGVFGETLGLGFFGFWGFGGFGWGALPDFLEKDFLFSLCAFFVFYANLFRERERFSFRRFFGETAVVRACFVLLARSRGRGAKIWFFVRFRLVQG